MDDIGPMIVVGLDDDPGAAAALRWAVAEARLRGAWVRAVYAYSEPVVADVNLVPLDSSPSLEQAQLAAEVWRDTALVGMPEASQVHVEVHARIGPPGPVLVDAAAGAVMLVVGSREHHPLYRLVHGSVSHYCLSRARCPVVAVPAPEAGL
ncbi:MAG TPA: universal stress protein [Micromonosporaceae bacterium]|jgi:nucleotide-binding universal stress UspA family protein